MQQTKTLNLDHLQAEKLKKNLLNKGFSEIKMDNPYIVWRLTGDGITVMYYTSGSLVAQGTGDMSVISHGQDKLVRPHIGSDEVGKGDYFGPLVVCSAYVDENSAQLATQMGVMDSKKLSDVKMREMYEKLKDSVKYSFLVSHPSLYNVEVGKYKNVAYYLADLHATAVRGLVDQLGGQKVEVVVDQFSANKSRLENAFKGMNVNLIQFHKGEQDIAVAVASVFARAIFLGEFDKMNEEYGMVFPKGATDVITFGKEFVKKYGKDKLSHVAKTSFRTTSAVLSLF